MFAALSRTFLLFSPMLLFAQPVLHVNSAPGRATTEAAVEIGGSVVSHASISNIYWVDGFGRRGVAEFTAAVSGQGSFVTWSARIPLQPGVNHLAVVATDNRNESATARFSIFREARRSPQVSEVRAGFWNGSPATYAVVDDLAIVEGDIILGTAAQLAASLPPGPGIRPNGFTNGYAAQLWPKVAGVAQIPYTIQSAATNLNAALAYVNTALAGILQFVPQTTETNYVTFNFNSGDFSEVCESSVGMLGGQQFITGSASCTLATLAHEMGHTIGLLHEHQRPDRNTFVTFTPANADKPWIAGNFDSFAYNDQTVGLYDYASVMHYPPFSFTKNNLPVLESIPAGIPLSNNNGYSVGDIDTIRRLYGAAVSTVTITTNPSGFQVIVDGVTYTAPHTFSWPLNSKHTLNLPPDPQVTSPNDGASYMFGKWNDLGARSHTVLNGGGTGSLTSPANVPATTVYEANFIRLWPYSASASPAAGGSASVSPAPQALFGGSFFVDRQQITISAAPNSGYNFYGWFGPPYPQSANPYPFLIQYPETGLQAAFTTFPVTVIGETITGPNVWNPPLYASVDANSFVDLPQAYSQDMNGAAWAPGTAHTISAPSPDVPVTTNVSYNWNNWSDGGGQTHSITAASSGTQRVSASYTPSYRSYAYSYYPCGGTVQYSQSCPNNDCSFADGTLLNMSAIPAGGSGMVFAGWTGDLSGTSNPQATTIHDEFLPNANFNVIPSLITVTSVAPSSPVKSANAATLTVNGTGFASGSFYAYWNNSYRASTVVSSTKATIQLLAGDLASAGAQLLQVSNYSAAGCGALAFTQILVRNTQGTPRLKITKTHQGNFTKGQVNATYTVTVSNQATATGSTAGKVTVTDTIPSGLTLVSMAGSGWTCASNSCSRTNALAAGASYPVITVTVNVSATAPSKVTNNVSVSGGNSPAATASDATTIN
ncbi:MAG: M12 family metallopeptidase [Bryobacteraceae bacterium]